MMNKILWLVIAISAYIACDVYCTELVDIFIGALSVFSFASVLLISNHIHKKEGR